MGARAAKARGESFISPIPDPVHSACCCQKLPGGCTSACFRGADDKEEEKDLLKVPHGSIIGFDSTGCLLPLTYPGPGFPVQCLCSHQGLCLYLDDFSYFFSQHNHCGLFPSSQCIFLDPVQEFYGRAKVRPVFCTTQLDPYFLLILLCAQVCLFLSQ